MLTIRLAQMDILRRELADPAFIKRVIEFLQTECPGDLAEYPEEQWGEMVANGISRARRYGIAYEASIAAFVALMFQYAPNFDEYPPIQEILADAEVPPDARMRLLGECTLDEDWDAVEERCDPAAWKVNFGG